VEKIPRKKKQKGKVDLYNKKKKVKERRFRCLWEEGLGARTETKIKWNNERLVWEKVSARVLGKGNPFRWSKSVTGGNSGSFEEEEETRGVRFGEGSSGRWAQLLRSLGRGKARPHRKTHQREKSPIPYLKKKTKVYEATYWEV